LYGAGACNEDEGVDVGDQAACGLSQPDAVNGTDSDFSDAGRCVFSASHANEHSAVCLTHICSYNHF